MEHRRTPRRVRRHGAPEVTPQVWAGPPAVDTLDPAVRDRAEVALRTAGLLIGAWPRGSDVVWRSVDGATTIVEVADPDGVDLLYCGWGPDADGCLAALEAALAG